MKSKKNTILLLIILFFYFFISASVVLAKSSYVLPYPSFMPGSKIYKIHILYEKLIKYWYFGDFAGFSYDLKEADKYLVEAKVLSEYKQYFLADKAIKLSSNYFANLENDLNKATKNHKNISEKKSLLREAALKHKEVLSVIASFSPDVFLWQPEKSLPSLILLKEDIEQALKTREDFL